MNLIINNQTLLVNLVDNDATTELINRLKEKDLTLNLSEYGGFEKVGPLNFSLPRSDTYITTNCGDIVLYSGNQISIFNESNSWSYTRLGKIANISDEELKQILGKGNVTITLSI